MIRFPLEAKMFLGLLLCALAVGTAFELHGSSVGMWNRVMAPDDPEPAALLGSPREIRSDEWVFATPLMISQARGNPPFAVDGTAWGPGQVPLIIDMPARHWSMLLRPQFWGFFSLDLERGFAFAWNMKAVLLLGGVFLLLMVLTGNDAWVSLLGACWVFFSGFTQWWYSTPLMLPELAGYLALALVALHYLVLSTSRLVMVLSAAAFAVSALNCAWTFYPPFQIPLLYLGLALLAGSLGPRLAAGAWKSKLGFRATCATTALLAIAGALVLYYFDARQAIELMRGTTYPGSRVATGGDVTLAQLFSGAYGFFMTEKTFPRMWGNVCEASNFLLLFPIPAAVSLWRAWRRQAVSALEWSLLLYLAIVCSWMVVGGPRWWALATGFSLSHDTRWLVGVGLASVVSCCVFLAQERDDLPEGLGRRLGLGASILALLLLHAWNFNRVTGGFARAEHVALSSLMLGAAGYLLLARRRGLFALGILVPGVWFFGLVNPVAAGLGPILESKLFRDVERITARDPGARWICYGSFVQANLLKAAGARVFNGTNVVPPLAELHLLDPDSSEASIYNRYAHMSLASGEGTGVTFTLNKGDLYTVGIDPRSDLWRQLGIRYVVLPRAATDVVFLRMASLVQAIGGQTWIYRYNWDLEPRAAGTRWDSDSLSAVRGDRPVTWQPEGGGDGVGQGQARQRRHETAVGQPRQPLTFQPLDEPAVGAECVQAPARFDPVEVHARVGAQPGHQRLEDQRFGPQRFRTLDGAAAGGDALLPGFGAPDVPRALSLVKRVRRRSETQVGRVVPVLRVVPRAMRGSRGELRDLVALHSRRVEPTVGLE